MACLPCQIRECLQLPRHDGRVAGVAFLDAVHDAVPDCEVRRRLDRARSLLDQPPHVAAGVLGNGSDVTAMDTVPYCLWVASRHLDDYEAALWETVAALGDTGTPHARSSGGSWPPA